MAKTKISEYSSTANSNTDIASINIDEGCAPSGINNAIRALMAQLKDFQTGAAGDPVTVGDVLTVKGASINDTNGNELFKLTATASAVNELTIANAATGGSPTISATGGDTNIGINLTPKGTGGVVFPAGAVGTPSITTSGDLNTGVYFPAADTVGITTGGTERVRVDSSGNVGVGVTPSAWDSSTSKAIQLQSQGANLGGGSLGTLNGAVFVSQNSYRTSSTWNYYVSGREATLYQAYQGQHQWLTAPSGTAGNAISFTQAMTLDASGNLLLARTLGYNAGTYQSQKLKVTGGIGLNSDSADQTSRLTLLGDSSTGNGVIDWSSGFSLIFSGNGTERARIDSSGNLLVAGGISSLPWNATGNVGWGASINSTYGLTANNNNTLVGIFNRTNGVGGIVEFKYNGATIGSVSTNGTSAAYNTSSDYRLKDVTGTLTGYKERLSALQPKQGSWKADGSYFRGFLAHEFAVLYPASVAGEKDAVDADGKPQYQGMQAGSSEVIADLVAYIKELETRLTALEQA